MTREEALCRVKGYLTDIIPTESYSEVEEIIKALEEVHKSKILCPICEYKNSPFMPCNACDESGSEFKKGGKE